MGMATSAAADTPTTSSLLFPELMSRVELFGKLRLKLIKMGASTVKLDKSSDEDLLEQSRKLLMPIPQRQVFSASEPIRGHANKRRAGHIEITDVKEVDSSKHGELRPFRKTDVQDLRPSRTDVNRSNGYRSTSATKRHNNSSTSCHLIEKKARKHSPIRFP